MNRGFWQALIVSLAAALLSACGGSQAGFGASAIPQGRAIEQHGSLGKPWMLPEAKREDLLYIVDGCDYHTCVLSYPKGKLVGILPYSGYATCSDSAGNVFLNEGSNVIEYAHGGTEPLQTLNLPGSIGGGCAVDPTTNNLAVVSVGNASDVAIFADETGNPTLYTTHVGAYYLGYDNQENLFVDGYVGQGPGFAELLKNGSSFETLSIPNSVGFPGQIQWDGTYMTYQSHDADNPIISRLAISGSSVTVVSTTMLKGIERNPNQSWLYKDQLVVPYPRHGIRASTIGYWKYPIGGQPKKLIKHIGDYNKLEQDFQGVTVSIAPSR